MEVSSARSKTDEDNKNRALMAAEAEVLPKKTCPSVSVVVSAPVSSSSCSSSSTSIAASALQLSASSNLFDPESECKSFSQLLAGAIASSPSESAKAAAKFKCISPSQVPQGFTSSSFLDSPVLPSSFQIPFPEASKVSSVPCKEEPSQSESGSSFVIKPFPKGPFEVSHQQVLAQIQAQAEAQAKFWPQSHPSTGSHVEPVVSSSLAFQSMPSCNLSSSGCASAPVLDGPGTPPSRENVSEGDHNNGSGPRESNQKAIVPFSTIPNLEKPSDDGYHWRKYGQKQVKCSEYPRSYYKCSHPNCPVKKKVERSYDGRVTEIVYRGEHDHPKPEPTFRTSVVSHQSSALSNGHMETEHSLDPGISKEHVEVPDPSTSSKVKSPERSCFSADSSSVANGDGEEMDAKRSKRDQISEAIAVPPLRTIRDARVVVHTSTDVDVLDDGYRWRKYGQKIVKGNPHPRSYYRCTSLGCTVRKHVERASDDDKAFITTYEGKHNHEKPAIRQNASTTASSVSPVPNVNTAITSPTAIKPSNQQMGNKQSAFSKVSENKPESQTDTNLQDHVLSDEKCLGENLTSALPSPTVPLSQHKNESSNISHVNSNSRTPPEIKQTVEETEIKEEK